ncbi:MAG: hydroxypyruvate isomerase family protein [Planctomycetota bacterium]|jgi:hydroxypyruvate isomerase
MKEPKQTADQRGRTVSRRGLLGGAAVAAAALAAGTSKAMTPVKPLSNAKFKLKYAPSLGQFKQHAGSDPLDRIQFMADQGFRAVFDNGLMRKPKDQQEAIAKKASQLDMTIGPFIASAEFGKATFVTPDKNARDKFVAEMTKAVEVGKRLNAKWALIVPGRYHEKLDRDFQTANVIENLKYCAEVCEPSGLVMVIEPLNTLRNHPGVFLTKISQAYQICRAVDSPSCKILNDIYHQQITEGNLIPNIDAAWDEIAAFHIGDTPGRKEPGTGEINYKNIFKHIHGKGYQGVLCAEHGTSIKGKAGEVALIEAYRACDDF